jgi:hypothetical protein
MPIPFSALGAGVAASIRPFANPLTWPALALAFGVGFCKGDDYRDRAWRLAIAKERAQQEQTLREADARLFAVLERLDRDKEKRDARIAGLVAKLEKRPRLKRGCLGPDVVRAINRALSR